MDGKILGVYLRWARCCLILLYFPGKVGKGGGIAREGYDRSSCGRGGIVIDKPMFVARLGSCLQHNVSTT